jgi:membrane protease YdiL (CAAX protease family)
MHSQPAAVQSLRNQVGPAVRHLAVRLVRSRLLLAYVVLGVLSGLFAGPMGLVRALVNYCLLGLYVLIIFLWTRNDRTVAQERAAQLARLTTEETRSLRRRDLSLLAVVFALNIGQVIWFWAGGPPMQLLVAAREFFLGLGLDGELAGTAANAASSTLFALLPVGVVVLLFRLRAGDVGLVPRHMGLGLFLILLGIAFAALIRLGTGQSTRLFSAPEAVPLALAIFAVHIFVNGLPEEFIFRGVMLSRVVSWLRNPHHALVLTSVIFVLSHAPSILVRGIGPAWWIVIGGSLVTPGPQPTGLVWAYLYYRTRSIWPGVLWHTSFVTLGVLFM